MLFLLAFLVLPIPQTGVSVNIGSSKPKLPDSVIEARREARRDSLRAVRAHRDSVQQLRRAARTIPVTPALIASAFRDAGAKSLVLLAREARLRQDSTLGSYDAMGYERLSVGMGISSIGRDHLLLRSERASHVTWARAVGAVVDVKGQRTVMPMTSGAGSGGVDFGGLEQVPYFPGRETLWIGSGLAKSDVRDEDIIHPLATGSEAYYTYETGDSVRFELPGGTSIGLKELRVRPRSPAWNVAVGSLWFDASSGQLVRAVYRLAVPMDVFTIEDQNRDSTEKDDAPPGWVKAIVSPIRAQVSAVTVEYGLHEGHFWLPRTEMLEGDARVSFMRIPFKIEQSYKYSSVNGSEAALQLNIAVADTARDSASRAARRARNRDECKTGTVHTRVQTHSDSKLRVVVRVPCDTVALARSAELPGSIYDDGEEVFSSADRDELIRAALGLAAQPGFAPQLPTITYGLSLTRYNRIEGLSTGIAADQVLGDGYTAHALARIGFADWSPNGELSLDRSNGRRTVGVGVYRRLSAANDWTDPLGFRSSLSALLFGNDEGFYYRNWGAEATLTTGSGITGDWRLFAEQEFNASVKTEFSFSHPGGQKGTLSNIAAVKGRIAGLATQHHGSFGLDPHGLRMLTDFKAEAAAGDFDYSRASLQSTVSHGLTRYFDGALTAGAGTSGGALPIQKQWFLGGVRTVRGQRPGADVGNAFWLSSVELGTSAAGIRKVVFADMGWAGDRNNFAHPGRPLSGAGVGVSFLDGLVRVDAARGIYPEKKIRSNLYVEARF